MKRTILLGLGLFILLSGNAFAGRLDRDARTYYKDGRILHKRLTNLRGKRGRKYARRISLRENLKGDKLAIYNEHGYTPHRLGYNGYGERTERWRYYSLGVEFWFDEDSNLIDTRYFPPEENHID